MARIARAVAPGIPHHVTQRGNRRQQTFFNDEDYQSYLELMSEWCDKFRVETWVYCLMPNHIHLIVVLETKAGPHMKSKDDILVRTKPLLEIVNEPWEDFLTIDAQELEIALFRKHERTGRPLGADSFIGTMEHLLGRKLKPQSPGPKKRDK